MNPSRLSNNQSNWLINRPITIIACEMFMELTLFGSFEFIFPSFDCSEAGGTRGLFFTCNTAMIVETYVIFVARVY